MYTILCLSLLLMSQVDLGTTKSALIIIDVQTCFLPGGSLAVTDGDKVIPVINKIRSQHDADFSMVVFSQDFHCPGHVSFYSNHQDKNPMDTVTLRYNKDGKLCSSDTVSTQKFPGAVSCSSASTTLTQVLWPPHCVTDVTDPSDPRSAAIAETLYEAPDDIVVKKGTNCDIDSYSVFFDNGGLNSTGLEKTLKAAGIDTVFVTGLALDYCVNYTSVDAVNLGFETHTVLDATRGVAPDTSEAAKRTMMSRGVHLIESEDIADILEAQQVLSAASSTVPVMFGTVSVATILFVISNTL